MKGRRVSVGYMSSAYADLLFTGGAVHTMVPGLPTMAAVAVREGRITAVGRDLRELAGPGTEIVDLHGKALVPGFQDAHTHPIFAGHNLVHCDVSGADNADEALVMIKAYARAQPADEWIIGGGWSAEWFRDGTPAKELLDSAVPDRPAVLINRDLRGSWANSPALARAGVDRRTPDPPDGRIERTADGTPQGTLHDGAVHLVGRIAPRPTLERQLKGLLKAQAHLHALGVTAWQDAVVGEHHSYPDPYDVYLRAAHDGSLTARVTGALCWDPERGDEQLCDLLDRRARGVVGRFAATSVKLVQGGEPTTSTTGLTDPYSAGPGPRRGHPFIDPPELEAYVTELDAFGFQIHFHAIGDRAIHESLNALSAAFETNGPNDHRHHFAHLHVVRPADLPRFAALGVVANIQPLWAGHEPEVDAPFLGPERAFWQYPWADLHKAGAKLAAGSDWPVSGPNPLEGLHIAVNRAKPGGAEPCFLPTQCLALPTALAAHTSGSAYVNHLDDCTGAIEDGRYADLVVLDRDPFAVPPDEIGYIQVEQTFIEGKRVYPT